jgi:hypothetical protein
MAHSHLLFEVEINFRGMLGTQLFCPILGQLLPYFLILKKNLKKMKKMCEAIYIYIVLLLFGIFFK